MNPLSASNTLLPFLFPVLHLKLKDLAPSSQLEFPIENLLVERNHDSPLLRPVLLLASA